MAGAGLGAGYAGRYAGGYAAGNTGTEGNPIGATAGVTVGAVGTAATGVAAAAVSIRPNCFSAHHGLSAGRGVGGVGTVIGFASEAGTAIGAGPSGDGAAVGAGSAGIGTSGRMLAPVVGTAGISGSDGKELADEAWPIGSGGDGSDIVGTVTAGGDAARGACGAGWYCAHAVPRATTTHITAADRMPPRDNTV